MILGRSALIILISMAGLVRVCSSLKAAYKCILPKPINIKHCILGSVDVSWRRLQDIQAAMLLLSFSDLRPYWIVFDIIAEYIRGFIQCSLNFKISCYWRLL
jgi:hypothetical protein